MSEDNQQNNSINKPDIGLIFLYTAVGILATIAFINFLTPADYRDEKDIYNWVSLVLELGAASGIAIVVWKYSNYEQKKSRAQQKEITKLVSEIKKIEQNQEKIINKETQRREKWKSGWGVRIVSELESIKNLYSALEKWLQDYNTQKSDQLKQNIISSGERLGPIVNYHVQNIKKHVTKIENLFDDPELGTHLVGQCEHFPGYFQNLDQDYVWEKDGLENQIQGMREMVKILEKDIQRVSAELPDYQKNMYE